MTQKRISELRTNDKIVIQSGNAFHDVIVSQVTAVPSVNNQTYYYLYGTYANTPMQFVQSFVSDVNSQPVFLCDETVTNTGIVITDTQPMQQMQQIPQVQERTIQPTQTGQLIPDLKPKAKPNQITEPPTFIQELENQGDTKSVASPAMFKRPLKFRIMGNTPYFQNNLEELNALIQKHDPHVMFQLQLSPSKKQKYGHELVVLWDKPGAKNPAALGFVPSNITSKLPRDKYSYNISNIQINDDNTADMTVRFVV